MKNEEKKRQIIDICKKEIEKRISIQTEAMNDAQETANKYKGAMESRYDTFKEEAQQRRDGHAKQIDTLLKQKSALMNAGQSLNTRAEFGSVIEADEEIYFLCFSISDDELRFNEKELITLREDTPLGVAMKGREKGDTVKLNGYEFTIREIY
ncbi:MAG: hypothetical protein IPN57_07990 [Ignavibacteria bacterium]|nr:hypothetical protein [Ignavibacteria bacterium]